MQILFLIFLPCTLLAAPMIKVSPETTYDFGKFPANEEKTCRFTISNTGDEILKIRKIRYTCGCSTGTLDKMELKPGENTTLTAKILKETIAGPFGKGLFIHSNAANNPLQMVILSGQAIPLITVLPEKLIYAGILRSSGEFKQDFQFRSLQDVSYGIPQVTSNLTATAQLHKNGPLEAILSVKITPNEKQKMLKCKISVPIKKPQNWQNIEIEIQGQYILNSQDKFVVNNPMLKQLQ